MAEPTKNFNPPNTSNKRPKPPGGSGGKRKSCKCVEKIDKLLVENNAKVSRTLLFKTDNILTLSPPAIVLEKIDTKKRKSLPTLFCTFCPFCGRKLC